MWSSRPSRCRSRFPIWVGGESAPALRRTVRYAHGWYPVGTNPQHPMNTVSTFRQGLERFHGFCQRGGRDPKEITLAYRVLTGPGVRPRGTIEGEPELFTGGDSDWVGRYQAAKRPRRHLGRCAAVRLWRGADPAGHDRQHASLPRRRAVEARLKSAVFSRMLVACDLSAGRGKLHEPGRAHGDGDRRPRARRGARPVGHRAGRAGSLPVRGLCGRATAARRRARCVRSATRAGRADAAGGDRLCDVRAVAGLCRARRGADRPRHRDFGRSDGAHQGARRLVRTQPGRVRDRHRDGNRRARQRAHDVTRPGHAAHARLAGRLLGSVPAGAWRGGLDFPVGARQAARPSGRRARREPCGATLP